MRSHVAAAIFIAAALVGGCVPSLHPLYTNEELVFEPALVGKWLEKVSSGTWQFEKQKEKEYLLIYTDNEGKSGKFTAHLLKIGETMYLDLFPQASEVETNQFYIWHFQPVHTFMKIRQITPTLQMAPVDPKWLDQLLLKSPELLAHERIDERLILTAPTEKLQQFFRKHADAEGMFGDFSDMRKAPSEADAGQKADATRKDKE